MIGTAAAITEWRALLLQRARTPRLRPFREFAEQSIKIPDGPFGGLMFRCDRQPYTRLLFDEIDSGLWNTIAMVGPTQSGKTLSGYIAPAMYHTCEVQESIILGVPNLDMARDKWQQDLLPAFEASPYRDLLPREGSGSKGGTPTLIRLRNGVTLRFMTAGGGDKSRAGATARVIIITELDGFDEPGLRSRETDKVTQIIARSRAYKRRLAYLECTVSIKEGRIWTEYTNGSESRIACPCPHCQDYVSPEREHLRGWKDKDDVLSAGESAFFVCPACEHSLDEDERREMNLLAKLVHRGQEINKFGKISGELPRTRTLGFRWSAFNNMLITIEDLAADEWKASQASDEDNAEREQNQFVWTIPHEMKDIETEHLDYAVLNRRTGGIPRGRVQQDATLLTVGVDVGKWLLHYVVTAWNVDRTSGVVVDYGYEEVPSQSIAVEKAILLALESLWEMLSRGFPQYGSTSDMLINALWVDSRYKQDAVFQFARKHARHGIRAVRGFGDNQRTPGKYRPQRAAVGVVRFVGDHYHFSFQKAAGVTIAEVDANHWKSVVHERLAMDAKEPGALTLFEATPNEHLSFAKHLTSEIYVEEYDTRAGSMRRKWKQVRRQNHFFDAIYMAVVAAHHYGARPIRRERNPSSRPRAGVTVKLKMPDGSPYLVTNRR